MTTPKSHPASATKPKRRTSKSDKRRQRRPRGTPRSLASTEHDDIAKRRLLMMLDVLSGRTPVTDAIERTKISRNTYYQLESKALNAMLEALTPSERGPGPRPDPSKKVEALEQKIERLETENRRLERLIALTDRYLKPGSVTTTAGRKRKATRSAKPTGRASASAGKTASKRKSNKPSSSVTSKTSASTPTKAGEDGSRDGSEN